MPDQRPSSSRWYCQRFCGCAVELEKVDVEGIKHDQAEMRQRVPGVGMIGRERNAGIARLPWRRPGEADARRFRQSPPGIAAGGGERRVSRYRRQPA